MHHFFHELRLHLSRHHDGIESVELDALVALLESQERLYELILTIEERLRIIEQRCNRYGVRIRQEFYRIGQEGNLIPFRGEKEMAITQGGTGTFSAALLDNGNPIPNPNPFTWSVDDTQASVSPSADTLSAVVTIPAGDPSTSVTITASTTAPDGSAASGTLVVQVQAEPQKFTVSVTQTA